MYTFETPGPVRLRVELYSGRVDVQAADTDRTTVELTAHDPVGQDAIDNARVEQRGDEILVLLPKTKTGLFGNRRGEVTATIQVPTDSAAEIETGTADITTRGRLGSVTAESGSGDVTLDEVGDTAVKVGSGDVSVSTVTGSLRATAGSGDVEAGSITGHADLKTGSGDVSVSTVGGDLKLKTGSGDTTIRAAGDSVDAIAGSGDLVVRRVDHGRLKAKTGSGDILVGVAEGTAAYLDVTTVTGEVTTMLEASQAPSDGAPTVELTIRAGTGDVVLQRA